VADPDSAHDLAGEGFRGSHQRQVLEALNEASPLRLISSANPAGIEVGGSPGHLPGRQKTLYVILEPLGVEVFRCSTRPAP
jgi:hypothetical protein